MTADNVARSKLTTIATFPQNFFLENLAVRANDSILVTVLNHKQLWYVPPAHHLPVTPVPVATCDHFAMGIVETEPDIFYVSTARQATLERFDMRGWRTGEPHPDPDLRSDRRHPQRRLYPYPTHHSDRRLTSTSISCFESHHLDRPSII
jgi:hypothetical protein